MIDSNIFDQVETFRHCTVQVLTNSFTGEQSIGWWREVDEKDLMPKCRYCGGTTVTRRQGGKLYQHCYACHMEFEL